MGLLHYIPVYNRGNVKISYFVPRTDLRSPLTRSGKSHRDTRRKLFDSNAAPKFPRPTVDKFFFVFRAHKSRIFLRRRYFWSTARVSCFSFVFRHRRIVSKKHLHARNVRVGTGRFFSTRVCAGRNERFGKKMYNDFVQAQPSEIMCLRCKRCDKNFEFHWHKLGVLFSLFRDK